MNDPSKIRRAKLFIAYARDDELFKDAFIKHCSLLKREGLVETWHDKDIMLGQEWETEIDKNLQDTDIFILLISPDFINSDYCFEREMQFAFRKQDRGRAIVVPIIIRPCSWKDTILSKLEASPRNALPVSQWENIDEAWVDVINELRKRIESLEILKRDKNHNLNIYTEYFKDILIIYTKGEIDVRIRKKIKEIIYTENKTGIKKIIIDLSNTDKMDSAALGTFMMLVKYIEAEDGRIIFTSLNKDNEMIFALIRLDKIFDITETTEQALASLLN